MKIRIQVASIAANQTAHFVTFRVIHRNVIEFENVTSRAYFLKRL